MVGVRSRHALTEVAVGIRGAGEGWVRHYEPRAAWRACEGELLGAAREWLTADVYLVASLLVGLAAVWSAGMGTRVLTGIPARRHRYDGRGDRGDGRRHPAHAG